MKTYFIDLGVQVLASVVLAAVIVFIYNFVETLKG